VGSLALSWYVSNFGNHNAAPTTRSLPSLSTIIVLDGAEIEPKWNIRPPATPPATLKRPGDTPVRMADEIGQAKT